MNVEEFLVAEIKHKLIDGHIPTMKGRRGNHNRIAENIYTNRIQQSSKKSTLFHRNSGHHRRSTTKNDPVQQLKIDIEETYEKCDKLQFNPIILSIY
ncbi:hypothetical protein [Methylotuvimicrobium buryatense]|uniref:hypothetical protein n=1 Tax=Methylotuvimicrobium buryatense TaxID=95641 RepID=UPI0003769CF3|nr:hypothetical protein [Methylotuvimicrobium buryatense]